MTPQQRRSLYDNASRLKTEDAKAIVKLMVENKLLDTASGGLPREHPLIHAIEKVCRSPEAREAAVLATAQGLPALAGVDPLIRNIVGLEYGSFDSTGWAGGFVVEEMESQGYRLAGSRKMPLVVLPVPLRFSKYADHLRLIFGNFS